MSNDTIKLRRYKNDLYVSGTGVIIMGAWSVIKALMEIILGPEDYFDMGDIEPDYRPYVLVISVVFVLLFMLLILAVHLYIGMNAAKAARGMDHKKGYIAGSIILLILTLISFTSYANDDPEDIDTTIASILVDLTTIYIFAVVVISSFRIKKLEEQPAQE